MFRGEKLIQSWNPIRRKTKEASGTDLTFLWLEMLSRLASTASISRWMLYKKHLSAGWWACLIQQWNRFGGWNCSWSTQSNHSSAFNRTPVEAHTAPHVEHQQPQFEIGNGMVSACVMVGWIKFLGRNSIQLEKLLNFMNLSPNHWCRQK
jgi:hypothetical protein